MPRDGSGIYSIPPGTQGAPDTTIESAKYNAYIADVETDLNVPRPVIAGGTGGNSAAAARDNIDAERSMQVVTNYDSMVWEPGSFYSAIGATGAPNATHAFAGIVYGPDANNMVIEARDLGDPETPGKMYVKEKTAGVWAPTWVSDGSDKVSKAGDTMTGNLKIQKASPVLQLDRTDALPTAIQGLRAGVTRWQIVPGDNVAESGANAGSNFLIANSNDAGVQIETPLVINRATGIVTAKGLPSYAEAQALTVAQQVQARKNLYAAPFDAVGWQNMLVNGSFDVVQQYGYNAAVLVPDTTSAFVSDQWQVFANGGSGINATVVPYQTPTALGLAKMLNLQSTAIASNAGANANFQAYQSIEGLRALRLNWGTGGGIPLSVCLMIYSAIAGTAVLSVRNGAGTRSYCTPITINAANTFEWKTVTIPPDTDPSGYYADARGAISFGMSFCVGSSLQAPTPNTWLSGNYVSLVGASNLFAAAGTTVRIAAVGAYPGSIAPLDIYQYANALRDFSQEQLLAKRYWQKIGDGNAVLLVRGLSTTTGDLFSEAFQLAAEMRAAPTVAEMGAVSKININGAVGFFTTARDLSLQFQSAAPGAVAIVSGPGNYYALNARI